LPKTIDNGTSNGAEYSGREWLATPTCNTKNPENNQQPPKSKLQDGMTPGLHHPANQQLQNQQCGEVVSVGDKR